MSGAFKMLGHNHNDNTLGLHVFGNVEIQQLALFGGPFPTIAREKRDDKKKVLPRKGRKFKGL